MAVLGMTKIQAINQMLRAAGLMPVSSLSTGNSDDAGIAEEVLDRVNMAIQMQGWPENVEFNTTLTPVLSNGAYTIVADADILWVRSCYRDSHRNFTLKGGMVYDLDRRTTDFGSTTAINVDICRLLDFDDLQPRTKELIAAAAARAFQMFKRGNPTQDGFLTEQQIIADTVADRIRMRMNPEPINPFPIQHPRQAREQR